VNKNAKRWIPAAVVPVVIATAAVAIPVAADASPALPEKTASQVLQLIAESDGTVYSGTIEQSSDLGLPDLSALGQSGGPSGDSSASALELVTGSHTARVFVGGADTQRLQVLDSMAERDVVRNGDEVWFYDSKAKEAVHATADVTAERPAAPAVTPAEAADTLLAAVESSTTVEVVETARVAGRSAYQLRLTPSDDATLVGSVTLSVDAGTGLPLEAAITAKGQDSPAFSVGFSSIDFSAPDAGLFDFTPPAGTTVTEKSVTDDGLAQAGAKAEAEAGALPEAPAEPEPTVIGDGWDAVVELPAGSWSPDASAGPESADLLAQLTDAVDGGRAVSTSLVSVLLTDDGRVLAGAVSVEALQAAAAR
jgi:outer membrane lipoprotein-sorting protein